PPAVKPRATKSKREGEGDWPSNEWDELSDVDYWAELASDKPLTGHAPSAPSSRSEGRDPLKDELPTQARAERPTDGRAAEAVTRQTGRRRRRGDPAFPPGPPAPPPAPARKFDPAAADRQAMPSRPAARPVPDDDPLTSPSFPRIASDDSRSYRRTRAAGPDRRGAERDHEASRTFPAGAQAPTAQHAYPPVPPVGPGRGLDEPSRSRSYPRSPAGGQEYPAAAASYPAADYPAADRGASGYAQPSDPYAALPSSRSLPSSNAVPVTYQVPAAASPGGFSPADGSYPGPDS